MFESSAVTSQPCAHPQQVQQCWARDPDERPTFEEIVRRLQRVRGIDLVPGITSSRSSVSFSSDMLETGSWGRDRDV